MSTRLKKLNAAREALKLVKPGMTLGVGSGSTVKVFIDELARKFTHRDLKVVAASLDSEIHLLLRGFNPLPLYSVDEIDLAIDGADEVDPAGNLIKGGGAALTREKIIDYYSKEYVIIVDDSKLVEKLCTSHPIPVEVIPIAWRQVKKRIEKKLGGKIVLREAVKKNGPIITDNGNIILDYYPSDTPPLKPTELETLLNNVPGVIENGVFAIKKPSKIIVGYAERVEVKSIPSL